jgi:hypothetical protein
MPKLLNYSILKVVAYFDLFDYPLTVSEIHAFLDLPWDKQEVNQALDALLRSGYLFRTDVWYSLRQDPLLIRRRKDGNARAALLIRRARRLGRWLMRFPYVRAVGVSGSLSKRWADEKADIDFFVITRENRLWISRTILHLFKKLTFLTGHQHWFCMNYWIDESALPIEEENIFTATELITLLPVAGPKQWNAFFGANSWVGRYFVQYGGRQGWPDAESSEPIEDLPTTMSLWKRMVEWIFSASWADRFDDFLFRVTSKRWKTKELQRRRNLKGNRMGLRTGKHYSKPNPEFFQQQVLNRFEKNMAHWEANWNADYRDGRTAFFFREII